MIEKLGGLKLPPFKYAVSGPSLCPGHLYRVDSRSTSTALSSSP
jgi:hypothetical protein